MDHLVKHKLLYYRQFAFRKHFSIELCCLDLFNSITCDIDDGNCVASVFIDFTKAFDLLDHGILLTKLQYLFGLSHESCG